ncbi:MAG: hypothetical protein Q7R87_02635 [Nanoarchaeota archaeon]|nr:hypothetical protein [Nanoarchaeota archaeon]
MGRAQNQRWREEAEAKKALSRRNFLLKAGAGAGLLAILGFTGWKAHDKFGSVSFEKAYENPNLRERWLQTSTDTRPYVKKIIATPEHLADLKARLDYTPEKGMSAATVMRDQSKVTRGAISDIFVYDDTFNPDFKRIVKGWGRVVENIVNNHELVHADHWYSGIPGYPSEWFFDKDGKIDDNMKRALLLQVSEVVAHRSEYNGLVAMDKKDDFIDAYQHSLVKVAKPIFVLAYALAKGNKELQGKIKREAWF